MGGNPPGVSVVYVNFRCEDLILRSIAGLSVATSPVGIEAIVVDNGSSKPEGFWDAHPVRLVRSEGNVGFGRACNLGAARARFDHVLFLNPDTVPRPDLVPRLLGHMRSHPGCSACGPVLVDSDGRRQVYWNFHHRLAWEIAESLYLQGRWRAWYDREMERVHRGRSDWPVDFVSGACLIVRKTDFDTAGGFDPRFFLNYEDFELCRRLSRRGELHYLTDLRLVHEESSVQRKSWASYIVFRTEGHLTYLGIAYRGLALWFARGLLVATLCSRLLVGSVFLRGNSRTRLPGYWRSLALALGLRRPTAAGLPPMDRARPDPGNVAS